MIRHCVMVKFRDEATPDQVADLIAALEALPQLVPEIRSYSVGPDAGLNDGNFDLVVVGDFDDVAGYRAYAANPDHVRVIETHLRPIVAQRTAVQYER
jgi:hypothetical protein